MVGVVGEGGFVTEDIGERCVAILALKWSGPVLQSANIHEKEAVG